MRRDIEGKEKGLARRMEDAELACREEVISNAETGKVASGGVRFKLRCIGIAA